MNAGWRDTTLGEVFEITSSKRVLQKQWRPAGVPFYRAREIVKLSRHGSVENDLFISEEMFDEFKLRYGVPAPGDLMVSAVGTLGACYVVQPKDRFYFKDASVLRFSPRKPVDPQFMKHAFRTNQILEQVNSGSGSTVGTYTISRAKKTRICLPPLDEQRRISAILDAVDALRAKRREALAQLDALVRSTFLDMFGDPVANPMGWEMRPLGNLADNEDGKRVPVKKADREKMAGEFPYYGASGVIDYVDDFLFAGERLLIGEDGANLVARSTPIAFIAKEKYWVNNHAHVLAFNGSAELIFLEAVVNSIDLKPYLSGTAQPKLNQKNLNRIPIAIPPPDLQRRFVAIVQSTEQQIVHQRAHLGQLDNLFACLQHRAFNGEL